LIYIQVVGEKQDPRLGAINSQTGDYAMKQRQRLICAMVVGLVGVGCVGVAFSAKPIAESMIDVAVTVSPSTIVLGEDKGASITVHTDIAYGLVDGASVALEGVPAYLTKADCRGNLVGKFSQEAIEALIAPPDATLTLTGQTKDGIPFAGSDTVRVIDDPSPED
jgi:hypothetical protein